MDLISRQAAIDALYDWSEHSMTDAEAWHIKQVIGDIKSLPAAQPVIIRCKDCNYFYDANFAKSWCNRMSGTFMVKPDSYCSFAVKRKENR